MQAIMARRAVLTDVPGIEALIGDNMLQIVKKFGQVSIPYMIETSQLAVTVVNEAGNVVAFGSFLDAPPGGLQFGQLGQDRWHKWFQENFFSFRFTVNNTIWLSFFVADPLYELDAADRILQTVFSELDDLEAILGVVPLEVNSFTPISDMFEEIPLATRDYYGPRCYACSRNYFVSPITIRKALIEDHDDLVPIFDQQSEVLTNIYGEFFLASLIESQNDHNHSLVAEVDGHAKGLMSLTDEVDVRLLQKCFELGPWDDLKTQEQVEQERIRFEMRRIRRFLANRNKRAHERANRLRDLSLETQLKRVFCQLVLQEKREADAENKAREEAVLEKAGVSESDMLPSVLNEANARDAKADIPNNQPSPSNLVIDEAILAASNVEKLTIVQLLSSFVDWLAAQKIDQEEVERASEMVEQLVEEEGKDFAQEPFVRLCLQFSRSLHPPQEDTLVAFFEEHSKPPEIEKDEDEEADEDQDGPNAIDGDENVNSDGKTIQNNNSGKTLPDSPDAIIDEQNKIIHYSDSDDEAASKKKNKNEKSMVDVVVQAQKMAEETEIAARKSMNSNATLEDLQALIVGLEQELAQEDDHSHDDENNEHDDDQLIGDTKALELSTRDNTNVFAISLFCLDDEYMARGYEFLEHAFDLYPTADFCLVTLPHTCPENALLSKFTLIPPKPTNTFSHVLYLCHRHSVGIDVSLRWAAPDDTLDIKQLISDMPNASRIVDRLRRCFASRAKAVENPWLGTSRDKKKRKRNKKKNEHDDFFGVQLDDDDDEKLFGNGDDDDMELGGGAPPGEEEEEAIVRNISDGAFVVVADDQVVGLVIMEAQYALEQLRSGFDVEKHINYSNLFSSVAAQERSATFGAAAGTNHANLIYFVLNPLFKRQTRFIFKEVMRYFRKDVIYYRVHPDGILQDVLEVFTQVKPRSIPAPSASVVQLEEEKEKSAQDLLEARDKKIMVPPYALHVATRRLLSQACRSINARIVMIGASDTALSCLESLLLTPGIRFTSITLVSRYGMPSGRADKSNGFFSPWNLSYSRPGLARLGLETQIRVVPDVLTSLDCQQKMLLLSDGSILPYDFLVLTPGLQDQISRRLGVPEDVKGVFSLSTPITKLRSYYRSHVPKIVVVNGNSLAALCAIRGLLDEGCAEDNIIWVHSDEADNTKWCRGDKMVYDKIVKTLSRIGVKTLSQTEVVGIKHAHRRLSHVLLQKVQKDNGDDDTLVQDDDADEIAKMECHLLIGCGDGDVDANIFSAVTSNSLVYDGRMVVDHRFRTADDDVFAAGPFAKFSRTYGMDAQTQEHFNSAEIGAQLALSLLKFVDPAGNYEDDPSSTDVKQGPQHNHPQDLLPVLGKKPQVQYGLLPGNLIYLHANKPTLTAKIIKRPTILITKNQRRFVRMVFDENDLLMSFTYLGLDQIQKHNLIKLIGLPASYLNRIIARYSRDEIDDLISFLEAPWATALYHDSFDGLQNDVKHAVKQLLNEDGMEGIIRTVIAEYSQDSKADPDLVSVLGAQLPINVKYAIQTKLLEFLAANSNHLPGYVIPTEKPSDELQEIYDRNNEELYGEMKDSEYKSTSVSNGNAATSQEL